MTFISDGVAPRAKMNQQRSRRFKTAREARLKREKEESLERDGIMVKEEHKSSFDSNCITPGTIFMDKVAKYIRYYAAERLNSDPGWKGV